MEKQPNQLPLSKFLPSADSIAAQDLEQYTKFVTENTTKNIREQLRIYKRIMEQPENTYQTIVQKYMGVYLLAEFVFGHTSSRHQILELLKHIDVKRINILPILKELKEIDHYRNISEILEKISKEQMESTEFNLLFFQPLLHEYTEATKKIQSENFSCKWLEVYLEIIRSINNSLKYYNIPQANKIQILALTKRTLKKYLILRRDILNQLFIILLTLNKEEPEPQSVLETIHYLHAKSVLYEYPILNKLLKYTLITETQIKYHLIYVLEYALEKEIKTYQNKGELFNAVIDLYQIGRSAYGMIQSMLKILINEGAPWKLDGHLSRNFFIIKVILKCSDTPVEQILSVWPEVIKTSLQYAGNLLTPFAIDCIEEILVKLHEQNNADIDKWISYWFDDYLYFLLHGERLTVKGIIQQLNPVIVKIIKKPILLEKLLSLKQSSDNKELGIISLLQCHKELGMISAVNEQKCYIFKDYMDQKISYEKLSNLLVSNEPNIACKALQFVSVSLKLSQPVVPFEFDLVFEYIKYSLGTNSSEYRHRYIQIFKKFFERLRGIYQKQLIPSNKKHKPIVYFKEFKEFILKIINHCAQSLYPEIPFQLTCPVLQVWLLVLNYFGVYQHQIKKGNVIQGCQILKNNNVFTLNNFTTLALLLQSSFQNIRGLALNILYHFPNDFQFDAQKLWNQCIKITNKLVIRQFQSGSRLLAFIYEKNSDKLQVIPGNHQFKQLNLYYYLLNLLKERFIIFKQEFTIQTPRFYDNLIHGVATTLSYMFDKLVQKVKKDPLIIQKYSSDIKQFMVELFKTMVEILNFSVDISGTNVSTVVLDSTQSVNRINNQMKIDCRGHFYQDDKEKEKQKESALKNLNKMISGSSLMTSMDDEDNPAIENTLVVSFYLVSKELGLIFNSIVSLTQIDTHQKIIPENHLIELVNVFFYALVNLKHMGSIDRISKGLERMSKVLYKKQSIQLISIPENLLKRLIQLLEDNKFTNILRRSAGVPYAFTCLLKSDALKKRQLVTSTMNALFKFASNESVDQLDTRIHAFNILKKLFQDSDLKFQLDPFVAEGFIKSIKGFGTEDWGVRNSSLMLFSALVLRTLGPKPRLNLIQFFKRCPSLIQFFQVQLKSYIENKVMYPPIYPIALLLSRMIPFDKVRSPANVDSQQEQPKQIHRSDFNKFIPLLQQAGNTPNCMGRIIIAKALFPFLQMSDILPFCLQILQPITIKSIKSNHNKSHSQLMNIYQLLNSYYNFIQSNKDIKQQKLADPQIKLLNLLTKKLSILSKIKCAFITQIYTRILNKFLMSRIHLLKQQEIFHQFIQNFKIYIEEFMVKSPPLTRFDSDLGDSIYRITLLKLYLKLTSFIHPQNSLYPFSEFFKSIVDATIKNKDYLKHIDYQIVTVYVKELLLKLQQSNYQQLSQDLKQNIKTLCFNSNFQPSQLPNMYRLLSSSKTILSPEEKLSLFQQQKKSLDPNLKIAIFQLLKLQINIDILLRFTDSQQLSILRETVVDHIQSYKPQFDIIYIRLLDDQDNDIRKQISSKLSKFLGLYDYNQNKIKEYILNKTSQKIYILNDTDFQIKKKNHQQQRIFSYDKANRYRSDIYNILKISSNLTLEQIQSLQTQLSLNKTLPNLINLQELIANYQTSIFSRNQYYFQLILKSLIHKLSTKTQTKESLREKIKNLDPILVSLVERF